ncbi:MAG: helix-turn-helix transcriptional regulator [Candidatus Aenigmarchaeota archaeon]|nr:helix-turn-helix transcriptional regulator [Candidatus Aenigmarchaeota archaeon]
MKEVRVDNLVKLYALLLLQKQVHGYEIIKTIKEKLGRNASPGQIYPFLKKLQNLGYVKIRKVGTRDKKVYVLTKSGERFSKAMIEKFGSMVELAVQNRLKTCAHCGCEIYSGGHSEKVKGATKYFCCPSCAKAFRK